MIYLRLLPTVLLIGSLAAGADVRGRAATPPVLRDFEPAETSVVRLPGPPVHPAPASAPKLAVQQRLSAPPRVDSPPRTQVYPVEFRRDAGLFCQKQIGQWTEADARRLLGSPTGRRAAADDNGAGGSGGHILAFPDPTGRFREIELDFDRESGFLRSVFAYPRDLTWQQCRRIWGGGFTAAEANKGRTFYSYLNRRLDVLVDGAGRVISLGLY